MNHKTALFNLMLTYGLLVFLNVLGFSTEGQNGRDILSFGHLAMAFLWLAMLAVAAISYGKVQSQ